MKPTVSADSWPIVLIHWPGPVEVSDIDEHFDEMERLLESRLGPFVVLVEVSERVQAPNAVVRARAGERLQGLVTRFQGRLLGMGYVLPSAFLRGVITAVHWLTRAEFPTTAVSTRAEAMAWAHGRLASSRG